MPARTSESVPRRWPALLRHLRAEGSTGGRTGRGGLPDVLAPLWPGASFDLVGRRIPGRGVTQYVALPRADRLTVLVPLRPRRAAAAVVRAHRSPSTAGRRVRHTGLVALARLGAADLLPQRVSVGSGPGHDRDWLADHLADIVGQPVLLGVHLGPPRANRKPVVQVLSSTGRTLAFAKVAVNDLTGSLVRAEGEALDRLARAGLERVTVPAVLHTGRWGGHDVLVLGRVDTVGRPAPRSALLQQAMVELSRFQQTQRERMTASGYWEALRRRLHSIPGPTAAALLAELDRLGDAPGSASVEFGCWHGDWTPWNMSWGRDRVTVWDWERFARDVPLGFDALHFHLQAGVRSAGATPEHALHETSSRAGALLEPFGVEPTAASWVLAAYLLELGTRYLHDDQERAGTKLGDIRPWLLPRLSTLVAELHSGPRR
jgi:hypothetical protein